RFEVILKSRDVRNFKSASKLYTRFLRETEGGGSVDEFLENNTIPYTDKEQLIKSRIGQSDFRIKLIVIGQKCSVSGYSADCSLIIASHIKPWSVCDNKERINTYNGLLLAPNLAKMIDKGMISFAEDGSTKISRNFRDYKI